MERNLTNLMKQETILAIRDTCSSSGYFRTSAYIDNAVNTILIYMKTYYDTLQYAKYFDELSMMEIGEYIATVYGETWEHMLDVLGLEYNPIHNVNEHIIEQHSGTDARTMTAQGMTVQSNTSAGTKDTSTDFVVPYDANTELESGKNESTYNHTTTTTPNGQGIDSLTHGEKVEKDREGNIGFMSNQYLISEEIKMRANNMFLPTMCTDIADILSDGIWGDE